MKSITIALGEKLFTVKALTIGQIEQINDLLTIAREEGHKRAATNREIIAAALAVDNPEVTAETIKGIRVTNVQEVSAAVDEILKFAGWILPTPGSQSPTDAINEGGKPSGEAQPA
ncbi:MAG: hypothetical protein ACP5P4_08040 [Steroidobacteraceae bacterium]